MHFSVCKNHINIILFASVAVSSAGVEEWDEIWVIPKSKIQENKLSTKKLEKRIFFFDNPVFSPEHKFIYKYMFCSTVNSLLVYAHSDLVQILIIF